MLMLGIDPGIIGGWAVVSDADGALIAAGDLPVAGAGAQRMVSGPLLREVIAERTAGNDVRAIIEDVHAMKGQGVSSSFKFGRAVGVAEGVCDGLGIPVSWVTPAKWKKALGLGADKEQSRQKAIRLWPASASLFARKKDHGRAEAALIALYEIMRRAS